MFPLPERDQNGSRVIFVQARKLDATKFNFSDILKIFNFMIFTLLEEEETQIAGFSYIFDLTGITKEYLALFSIMDTKNYLECVQNAIPARQKGSSFMNLPSYGEKLVELFISFVSLN
jgi:hypothetical protein